MLVLDPSCYCCFLHGEPLTSMGEGKLLDFLWVEDAVSAMLRASELAPPGSIFNIGSGRGAGLLAVAQRLVDLTGRGNQITTTVGDPLEVSAYVADIGRAPRNSA